MKKNLNNIENEIGNPEPISVSVVTDTGLLLTEMLGVRVCHLLLIHVGLLKYQLLGRSVPPVPDNDIT